MPQTAAVTEPNDPELQATAWDLEPLVDGEGEAGVQSRLEDALTRAKAFAERYAGQLGELDSAGLEEAMTELAAIYELLGRAGSYAALRFYTDTATPANGALLQKVQEGETQIATTLLFFELEWAALSDERAEELLTGEGLDFCRHYLRNVRRYREHLLTEPEEKILAEKALTGAGAWSRLFEELTSAIEVELPTGAGHGARRARCCPEQSDGGRSRRSSHDRRGGDRGARAGTAHAGVPVQHAAGRQGDR